MSEIKYELIKEFGMLDSKKNSPELNIVKWNNKEPKWDIRRWSEDGKEPYKGISLTNEEAKRLLSILPEAISSKKNETPLYDVRIGKGHCLIYNTFGVISEPGIMTTQLLYVSWGRVAKYDLRMWTEGYNRCTKGIPLSEKEINTLYSLLSENLKNEEKKAPTQPKGVSIDLDNELFI